MQQILHQIRTKGDENFNDIYEVAPFFEVGDAILPQMNKDQVAEPRIYKSHWTYEYLQNFFDVKSNRIIVTVRDPYDSAYSLVKFNWRFFGFDRDVSASEYEQIVKDWVSNNIKHWFFLQVCRKNVKIA